MTRILGKKHPFDHGASSLPHTRHRGSVVTEPRGERAPRPMEGGSEPSPSARGPTSRYWCPEPRANPLVEHLRPNPRAAMSVAQQTPHRWRTPLRPPPSLFDDAYLDPPTRFDAAG